MRKTLRPHLILLLWSLIGPFSSAKDLFLSGCENQLKDVVGLVQSIQDLAQSHPELAKALYDPLRVLQTEPEQLSSSELTVRTLYEKIWQQLNADSEKLLLSALRHRGQELSKQSAAWTALRQIHSALRVYAAKELVVSEPIGSFSTFHASTWIATNARGLLLYKLDQAIPGPYLKPSHLILDETGTSEWNYFWDPADKNLMICFGCSRNSLGECQSPVLRRVDFRDRSIRATFEIFSFFELQTKLNDKRLYSMTGPLKEPIRLPQNFWKTFRWDPETRSLYADIADFRIFLGRGTDGYLIVDKAGPLKRFWMNLQTRIKNSGGKQKSHLLSSPSPPLLPPLPDCIRSFISQDSKYLICQDSEDLSNGLSLQFIRLEDQKILHSTTLVFKEPFQQIQDFVLSPDFRYLIVKGISQSNYAKGTRGNSFYLFNLADQDIAKKLTAP